MLVCVSCFNEGSLQGNITFMNIWKESIDTTVLGTSCHDDWLIFRCMCRVTSWLNKNLLTHPMLNCCGPIKELTETGRVLDLNMLGQKSLNQHP